MAPPEQSLKRTPLYPAHQALGGRLVPFAGWEMPVQYAGQLVEHAAVRKECGIFDVSHMGQVRFSGPRVTEYLDAALPGDLGSLGLGQSRYTQILNPQGGVLDDLIVSRLGAEEFFAVVNASMREQDVAVLKERAAAWPGVVVTDESDHWAMIAVQGPRAPQLLKSFWPDGAVLSPAFTIHPRGHAGTRGIAPAYLSRTGYTGETGGELIVPAAEAPAIWQQLLDLGAVPCGLAARDSLRLEAGYCLYGNDLSHETSPVAASIGWSVGWKKAGDFVGRAAIEAEKAAGAPRRLIGIRAEGRRPLRRGETILRDGVAVGQTTSGGYSPVLECGIALAYVDRGVAIGSKVAVDVRGQQIPAVVVKPPFVSTSLKTL